MQQKFDTTGLSKEAVLLAVFKLKYKPSAAISSQKIDKALTLENAESIYNNPEYNKSNYFNHCQIGDLPPVMLNAQITDNQLILFQTVVDYNIMLGILNDFQIKYQPSYGMGKI